MIIAACELQIPVLTMHLLIKDQLVLTLEMARMQTIRLLQLAGIEVDQMTLPAEDHKILAISTPHRQVAKVPATHSQLTPA